MPWKAPTGKGGVHVSRRADGSTGIKGVADFDPTPPTPEDVAEDEFDAFARLMSTPPGGVSDGRSWFGKGTSEWEDG